MGNKTGVPLTIHCLRDPSKQHRKWLETNCFAALARLLPEDYSVRDFLPESDRASGLNVIMLRLDGPLLDNVRWALAQPGVREWLESGVVLVFDDATEASLSGPREWQSLRRLLDSLSPRGGRFIWLQQNEGGPRMCAEAFAGQSVVSIKSVVMHFWMHHTQLSARDANERPLKSVRDKRFLCFNRRLKPHRAATLGWLLREGLIERGLVSVGRQQIATQAFPWPTIEAFEEKAQELLPDFGPEILASRDLHGLGFLDAYTHPASIPWNLHARTGFSLINEYEMRDSHVLRFTEKSLKPLAAWHPIIVAGNPGTLELLRRYGFKTFSPWIDESYDTIEDPQARLRYLLNEAKRLITLPDEEFNELLENLEPVLLHNHEHFRNGLPAIMDRQHKMFQTAVEELTLPTSCKN